MTMMTMCFNQMQMFTTDTSHLPADKVTLCKQLDRDDVHNDHHHEDNHDDGNNYDYNRQYDKQTKNSNQGEGAK